MKCFQPGTILDMQWSPSMRREWIEIYLTGNAKPEEVSPSMRREWIEIVTQLGMSETYDSLPPCGGSGLKL